MGAMMGLAALALWAALVFPAAGEAQPAGQEWTPGDVFKDCAECPEMVVVPQGVFRMGSEDQRPNERPVREVQVASFAMGRFEVKRSEFEIFASATGWPLYEDCRVMTIDSDGGRLYSTRDVQSSWRAPGFDQDGSHPVVCVSWVDAVAYTVWLSGLTGQIYRLPSEAEWEYAARGPWGSDWTCDRANGMDGVWESRVSVEVPDCYDGAQYTAAVGRYGENEFGLFDMMGNVWEWVADVWKDSYDGAPRDGAVWGAGRNFHSDRGIRGGGWDNIPAELDASRRNRFPVGDRGTYLGFRVARSLP